MDMAYEARRAMDGHFIGKADCKIGYGMYENSCACEEFACLITTKLIESQCFILQIFFTYIDLIILEISM